MLPYLEGNPVRAILSHDDEKPAILCRVSYTFRLLPNVKEINMEEKKENVMDWIVEDVGKEIAKVFNEEIVKKFEGKLTHLTVQSNQLSCF